MDNTKVPNRRSSQKGKRKILLEAVVALLAFYTLSLLSRLSASVYLLVIGSGLFFPLIWAKRTGDWEVIGFTRRNTGKALLWGMVTGLLCFSYTVLLTRDAQAPPPMLGLQLAIGIPLAFLVTSPFQEFFFRGWLQPRFEIIIGKWPGLIATALCFAIWHYLPPFELSPSGTAIKLATVYGFLSLLGLGLVWGYIFQRIKNIIAPWLAHTLAIAGLIVTGAMTLVQYNP